MKYDQYIQIIHFQNAATQGPRSVSTVQTCKIKKKILTEVDN